MFTDDAIAMHLQSPQTIRSRRRDTVGELTRVFDDVDPWKQPDARATARHLQAVDRLVDLRAEEAIETLLWTLRCTGTKHGALHDHLVRRLPDLGPAVLEPALTMIEGHDSVDPCVCKVLARLGVRDRRCLRAFRHVLEDDPAAGARLFAAYGDRRARGLLRVAIRKLLTWRESRRPRGAMHELLRAYAGLGGLLSQEAERQVTAWLEGG